MNPRSARRAFAVIAALGLLVHLAPGCGKFEAANDGTDGGVVSPGGDAKGIPCGATRCAGSDVCCFDSVAGTESCTATDACRGTRYSCKTTADCRAGDADSVCCASNDGDRIIAATCTPSHSCDALFSVDWLCTSSSAATECTDGMRPDCKPPPLPAPSGVGFCVLR